MSASLIAWRDCRWPMGLYLGLTGRAIGRADAHWLGLATHCIPGAAFHGIIDAAGDAEPIDPLLDGLHEAQPARAAAGATAR